MARSSRSGRAIPRLLLAVRVRHLLVVALDGVVVGKRSLAQQRGQLILRGRCDGPQRRLDVWQRREGGAADRVVLQSREDVLRQDLLARR